MKPERIDEIALENIFKYKNGDSSTWELKMVSEAIKEALEEENRWYYQEKEEL